MANVIKLKRSYTASNIPTLASGEVGINATDGKIWIGNAAGNANVLVSSLTRSDHTGTLTIASGGTGATSANAAANAILPSQTSNNGKYLTTNGTDTSWGTVSAGTTLPAGSMQMYAGVVTQSVSAGMLTTSAPTGWLLANGDLINRGVYSALFTAIGTTYGAGDGSTTFALPDMRGRVASQVGTGTYAGATARTLGGTLGTETETLAASQIPAHSHPNTVGSTASSSNNVTAGMSANTTHGHNLSESVGRMALGFNATGSSYAGSIVGNQPQAGTVLTAATSGSIDHTHNVFIANANNTGGGGSHNNMQPTIGLNFIIKT
jgi:microcystin-dependent protein